MTKKLVINIATVNVYAGEYHGARETSPLDFLAALVKNAPEGAVNIRTSETSEPPASADNTQTATEAVASESGEPAPTRDAVLSFLGSDPRYSLRSLASVIEHFGDRFGVYNILDELVDEGVVVHKTRRSDGVSLYGLNAGAGLMPSEQPLTRAQVRDFLRSDERFTWRTRQAIVNHFAKAENGGRNEGEVITVLNEMVYDDELNRDTRPRDGEVIYRLA